MTTEKTEKLYHDLFEDMKQRAWAYHPQIIRLLFEGIDNDSAKRCGNWRSANPEDDILNEFLMSGNKITIEQLIENGMVPENFSVERLTAWDHYDYDIKQMRLQDLGEYPQNRTDILFLGMPCSGKTSILASVLYSLWVHGNAKYVPHLTNGRDVTLEIKDGLIKCIAARRYPCFNAIDNSFVLKYDIDKTYRSFFGINRKTSIPVTFVETAGGMQEKLIERFASSHEFEDFSLKHCFECKNQKVLFFIIDYSVVKGIYPRDDESSIRQKLFIENALHYLFVDGEGRDNHHGCTMSKVKAISFIVTKCDLMENANTWSERKDIAEQYILNECSGIIHLLDDAYRKYKVNVRDRKGHINVLPFSMGMQYVGRTYDYEIEYADHVIDFLQNILH